MYKPFNLLFLLNFVYYVHVLVILFSFIVNVVFIPKHFPHYTYTSAALHSLFHCIFLELFSMPTRYHAYNHARYFLLCSLDEPVLKVGEAPGHSAYQGNPWRDVIDTLTTAITFFSPNDSYL